ncbi:hypothetical protein [Spirosoma aerophilum]
MEIVVGSFIVISVIIYLVTQLIKNKRIQERKRQLEADLQSEILERQEKEKRRIKIQLENKKEEQKRLKLEQDQIEKEKQKRLKLEQDQTEKEQRKKDEEERLQNLFLQKQEEDRHEILIVVNVINKDDKFILALKRENNTYAYKVKESNPFQLNQKIRVQKVQSNGLTWFSETEHYIKLERIELYNKQQIEIKKQKEKDDIELYQKNFSEYETIFTNQIDKLFKQNPSNISFNNIRKLSVAYANQLSKEMSDKLHQELNGGISIIETEAHLHKYIHAFGNMHQAKLIQSFQAIQNLEEIINGKDLQIIDYGCGQGIGSIVFIDCLKLIQRHNCTISQIRLIEPSELALKRASCNVKYSLKSINQNDCVLAIHKPLDDLITQDLITNETSVKFHIFSNILDVESIDIKSLFQKINMTQKGVNYFICVSPKFWDEGIHIRNLRLDAFVNFFMNNQSVNLISQRTSNIHNPSNSDKPYKRYEKIFKVVFS